MPYGNSKESRIAKPTLKKNKVRRLKLPYYKVTVKKKKKCGIDIEMAQQINGAEQGVQKCFFIYTWTNDFGPSCKSSSVENEQSFQQIMLAQLDIHMQKTNFDKYLFII